MFLDKEMFQFQFFVASIGVSVFTSEKLKYAKEMQSSIYAVGLNF